MVLRMLDTGDQGTEEINNNNKYCVIPLVRSAKDSVYTDLTLILKVETQCTEESHKMHLFMFLVLFINIPTKEIMAQLILSFHLKIVS